MKHLLALILSGILYLPVNAQSFDSLPKLPGISQQVHHSSNVGERAKKIQTLVAEAEAFFIKELNATPSYTLLVLNPTDWKRYAHPNAIYGIPHYLPGGRLVVAAENNDFWKRNTPPLDKMPDSLAAKMKTAYGQPNGEIDLTSFFDLLAIHELGHAFQRAAGITRQRSWLSELQCNILLHTFVASKRPDQLASLTSFPIGTVAAFPKDQMKFSSLQEFETNYNEIAQKHPVNYGWYQCRFHKLAGEIYDQGGRAAMKDLWQALLREKDKLDEDALQSLLKKANPVLSTAIANW